jgi:hypothetical protein
MLPLAYCGNDCNACPRYVATLSGNREHLKAVANCWKTAGLRDTTPSPHEMICYGCSSTNTCTFLIRECALGRGVDNCGRCEQSPCQRLANVFQFAELSAKKCRNGCSKEEYHRLHRAFFSRERNLNRVNKEHLSQRKDGASH